MNAAINKLSKNYKTLESLTVAEWNIVNDYITLMRPIAISLDKLQGEKNVGVGSVLPCLFSIKAEISAVEPKTKSSNNPKYQMVGQHMKTALLFTFENRFSSFMTFNYSNRTFIVAAVSNPVYKLKWISNERDVMIARNYFEEEVQKIQDHRTSTIENLLEDEENAEDEFVPLNLLSSTRRISTESSSIEISNFLEDRDKNFSMLSKYHSIDKVFRKFNTTLSASSPIERLFSQALIVCTPRRNRISHVNFEKALLLKQNRDLW